MGAVRSFLFVRVRTASVLFLERTMKRKTCHIVHSAIVAALYVVLTHLQNIILPGSATWAIQFRVSEALCVLALFTPAAVPGLSLGCLLFNITYAQALPLDFVAGTLATALTAMFMWKSRSLTLKGYPLFALVMPALWNALIVGWELSVYIGGGFWVNAVSVALGELGVLFTLGTSLFYAIRLRRLDSRLFGN